MKKADYLLLFILGVVIYFAFAFFQKVPGYMDAEYYYVQGMHLIAEHNLNETFIWNYLNNPSTLPVAGFSFWLPLTSFLAAAGIWMTGVKSFFAGRFLFLIMAAMIPVLTAKLTTYFLYGRRAAWLAGGLALFSGLFFPYATVTDTFTPFMFLGGFLMLVFVEITNIEIWSNRKVILLGLIGIIIGLMALTRSEGILWLLGGVLFLLLENRYKKETFRQFLIECSLVILCFGLIMIPWYIRNFQVFGSLYPPGNGLMLWLTNYDDLFVYPSYVLTFSRWASQGISIAKDRFSALWLNLQTLISAGGAVVLFPLMVIGFIRNWKKTVVIVAGVMLCLIGLVMSFAFPYAGARGGFFHSLSSFQVLLWSFVPVGLEIIIQWGIKHRKWKLARSWIMFGAMLIVFAAGLSIFMFFTKLHRGVEGTPWNDTLASYLSVDRKLEGLTKNQNAIVMVNDPPGFSLATGRRSVMIPSGNMDSILAACNTYNVAYLVLDQEREDIKRVFNSSDTKNKKFKLLFENGSMNIYEYVK